MISIPDLLTFITILFLGSIAAAVVNLLRPRFTRRVALSVTALTLLLWLVLPGQLPLTFNMADGTTLGQSTWLWQVDRLGWLLSLSLLLLQMGALLLSPSATMAQRQRLSPSTAIILLGTSTLFSIWASSLIAFVISWTLLSLVTLLVLWASRPDVGASEQLWRAPLLSWSSIFLIWLAAISLPGTVQELNVAAWPTLTKSLALFAVILQMAVFLLYAWRPLVAKVDVLAAVILHVAPITVGAMLLLRLEAASDIGFRFALPLTLIGLLGLLFAVRQALFSYQSSSLVALALILSQTSFILLAGVWADPEAVLAETRVLLLAGGILLFATSSATNSNETLLHRAAPLLAAGAVVGLPLTAGFSGRAALYSAWIDQQRWILLLVAALLHVPLAAAAFLISWNRTPLHLHLPQIDRSALLIILPLLLPALGLLAVAELRDAHPAAWVAILLPALAGLALVRFEQQTREIRQLLREAFTIKLPWQSPAPILRRALSTLTSALREAAAVLEGEGGLLWLLLFLVILWLAR